MSLAEWLPGTAVGLGGLTVAWFTARWQKDSSIKVAELQAESPVQLAREERRAGSVAGSYESLFSRLLEVESWALVRDPSVIRDDGREEAGSLVAMPKLFVALLEAEGKTAVYWSPRVRQLIRRLRQRGLEYSEAIEVDLRDPELFDIVEHDFHALMALINEVRDQLSAELRGTDDGHARGTGRDDQR